MSSAQVNIMSIDLEDWFCVYNLSGIISPDEWGSCESRVERNTMAILELFSRRQTKATFFVLGWVADRFPDLIREIDRQGHEIASHGYSHRLLTHMTAEEFDRDLQRSVEVLARCVSQPVLGFRAPSFSLTQDTLWAVDKLWNQGIRYDSSVFPIGFHPDYGIGDAPLIPYRHGNGLLEVPMSCAQFGSQRIPCSGGGYFRLLPYPMTRALMKRCMNAGRRVIFYLHPWEIDPQQPRIKMPRLKAFRHYNNLDQTMSRMERLLTDFRFTSFRNAFAGLIEQ